MINAYHVRVHYRTGNKLARRVSWFPKVYAADETKASERAIERITSRKCNKGIVEVERVDVRLRS